MPTTIAPGISPLTPYHSTTIDCPYRKYQCAFGWTEVPCILPEMEDHPSHGVTIIGGYFWLKFINLGCSLHSKLPHGSKVELKYVSRFTVPIDRNRGQYK